MHIYTEWDCQFMIFRERAQEIHLHLDLAARGDTCKGRNPAASKEKRCDGWHGSMRRGTFFYLSSGSVHTVVWQLKTFMIMSTPAKTTCRLLPPNWSGSAVAETAMQCNALTLYPWINVVTTATGPRVIWVPCKCSVKMGFCSIFIFVCLKQRE